MNSLESFAITKKLYQNQCLKFRDHSRSFQSLSNIIQSYASGCAGLDDSSIHPNEPGLNFRVFIAKQPFTPRTCYTVPRAALREEYSELLLPSCRSRRVPAGGSPLSGCRHSAAPGRQGGGRRRGRAPAGAALERAAAELRGSCARSRAPAAGRAPPSGDPQACR